MAELECQVECDPTLRRELEILWMKDGMNILSNFSEGCVMFSLRSRMIYIVPNGSTFNSMNFKKGFALKTGRISMSYDIFWSADILFIVLSVLESWIKY